MSIPVEKTLDDIRTDLFDKISSVQQSGWLPQWLNLNRGPVRGMIELWAWGLYQLYLILAGVLQEAFPSTATGKWLDLHCKVVGITRLIATKTTGQVKFFRTGTTGNVPISSGTIVKTSVDGLGNVYRFITTTDAVLLDGTTEIYVEAEAEEYGKGSNVTTGQISEIVTTISGVDGVTNDFDWLTKEGTDLEDDEALQERYALAWKDVNGATKYAYESWARSVTGVESAKIIDNQPRGQGTVDVVIRGSAGIPTQQLLDDVDIVVQNNRPINDDALVKAPTSVPVDIDIEIELVSGDPAALTLDVENYIRALFDPDSTVEGVSPLDGGEDLPLDRITAAALHEDIKKTAKEIKKINFTAPVADVSVPADGLATLNSINVTYIWATEP